MHAGMPASRWFYEGLMLTSKGYTTLTHGSAPVGAGAMPAPPQAAHAAGRMLPAGMDRGGSAGPGPSSGLEAAPAAGSGVVLHAAPKLCALIHTTHDPPAPSAIHA